MRRVSVVGVIAAARRYRRFPQFTSWAALLNTASFQAPTILLSAFFGSAITGLFALGQQVLMMPISLVAKSASQVFYSEAIDALRINRLNVEIKALIIRLSRLALPLSLAVALVSPEVFSVIFGYEWRVAGIYCQWQALWLLMAFLTLPLSPLVAVLERQAADTTFQFALLAARSGAILVGGLAQDPMIAIALFGIASGGLRAIYLAWLLKIGGVSIGGVLPAFLKELTIALAVISPMLIAKVFGVSDKVTTLVAISCGLFFLLLIACRTRISAEGENSTAGIVNSETERKK